MASDFVPTLDEELNMLWREFDRKPPQTTIGTTGGTTIANVAGGKRFIVDNINISDARETVITHNLGFIPTRITVIPNYSGKTVHRQCVQYTLGSVYTINHNLNIAAATYGVPPIEMGWTPLNLPGSRPVIHSVVSANTLNIMFV
jgi:hypothetical protein